MEGLKDLLLGILVGAAISLGGGLLLLYYLKDLKGDLKGDTTLGQIKYSAVYLLTTLLLLGMNYLVLYNCIIYIIT